MKKVIMKISIAGHDFSYVPGDEVELADYIADAWEEAGHCELVEATAKKRGGKNDAKS